ncbi:flavin reductase [Pandoraea sp.]|uniref:flavin reductase n=1 Tax=Pandoraea sp. TaxID=1883445 RepID=UPI0012231430|nr:flavin reductase [Pandoraea sp.]MBU6491520.1 flavin reductase [Burkholderiales bacterium]MDE2288507.1 flavin reductase [Burkholderiales bacterium]TAL55056.1 MAG: flavin reductase [Pandoraea sp.]TAM19896.1 MAG: flavin reductase [Pandoraea sp.]
MVDKTAFRDAMAGLGAAVNIITTDGPAGRAGCTASAVCGVTDEPPMLLVCIHRASRNNAAFRANGRLCVNVLSAEQRDVAVRFATKGMSIDARFAGQSWDTLATGAPALHGAVTSLDCEVASVTEVGTHTVFFCTIQAVRTQRERDGLIYFGRDFHRVGPATLAAAQ